MSPTPPLLWVVRVLATHSARWILIALLGLGTAVHGQEAKGPPLRPPVTQQRVSAALIELLRDTPRVAGRPLARAARDQARQRAAAHRMKVRQDDKVLVEIIAPATGRIDRDLALPALETLGVEIGRPFESQALRAGQMAHAPLSRTERRTEAWLPLHLIERMEELLPAGYRVVPVRPIEGDQVLGEGPGVMNSDTYNATGAGGAGVTIAVIDGGFSGLTNARNNGDAPNAVLINLTTEANFESGTSDHGTNCVEVAFDHAPNATWRIYRVDSAADYTAAITDCIANGVDIISHSISRYNEGWEDDSGVSCLEANRAAQNGILFFTSAGNRATSHYEGQFTDSDGDGWHEFATGDESINVTVGSMNQFASHYLAWSNALTNFDFYLYDSTMTNVLAQSENGAVGVFEEIAFTNSGAQGVFCLMVRHRSGPTDSRIEVFSHNSATWNEHIVAAGSTTSPSNSSESRVVTVGAVTHTSFTQPAGANVIAVYSSRGPSNSGRMLPELCGPTDTVSFNDPGGFGGTSCATPNVAGAAAAFWSADLTLSADAVRWLLVTQARTWRDWGAVGSDNNYGAGGLTLIDFHPGTRWLARGYPGTLDDGTVPFHTVAAAEATVPSDGRLLIFGAAYGTFPEAITLGNTQKRFVLEVVPGTLGAILGD